MIFHVSKGEKLGRGKIFGTLGSIRVGGIYVERSFNANFSRGSSFYGGCETLHVHLCQGAESFQTPSVQNWNASKHPESADLAMNPNISPGCGATDIPCHGHLAMNPKIPPAMDQ